MKKILSVMLTMLLALSAFAQTTYRPPTVYVSSGLTVKRTAGTVNNGGKPVAVAADTTGAAMTDSKNDCAAPTYTACNIIYANSSGTVATTTSIATASATGNVIIAYVTTTGGAVTSIVYGWQNGAAFSNTNATAPSGSSAAVYLCGTTTTCAVTLESTAKIVYGTVALSSGTPSQATLTALPFTGTTTYVCTATPVGTTATIAGNGIAVSNVSASSATLTGPDTVTTVIDYTCIGT